MTGYRIFFLSAFWGIVFGLLGAGSARLSTSISFIGPLTEVWTEALPPADFAYSGSSVLALGWSGIAILIGNLVISRPKAKKLAILLDEDELLAALVEAAESFRKHGAEGAETAALLLTMSDRKVYGGYVVAAPSVNRAEAFVQVLPLVSGHRSADTLKPRFDWNYVKLWGDSGPDGARGRLELFTTRLPMAEIRCVRPFDEQIFLEHFADGDRRTGDSEQVSCPNSSLPKSSMRGAVGLAAILAGLGLAAFARR